jgi:hypothetical protein
MDDVKSARLVKTSFKKDCTGRFDFIVKLRSCGGSCHWYQLGVLYRHPKILKTN